MILPLLLASAAAPAPAHAAPLAASLVRSAPLRAEDPAPTDEVEQLLHAGAYLHHERERLTAAVEFAARAHEGQRRTFFGACFFPLSAESCSSFQTSSMGFDWTEAPGSSMAWAQGSQRWCCSTWFSDSPGPRNECTSSTWTVALAFWHC